MRKKKSKQKIETKKIETFFIKKIKKLKSYELNLLENVKIHLVFNISLLKLIDQNTLIQEIFHYNKQKKVKFKVKIILRRKNQKYFVK